MKFYILMTRICKQFYSLSTLVPQSMRTIIYKQIYGIISNTVPSHMCMMIKNSLRLRSVYFHIKTSSTIRWIRNCPFDKWRFFPRNSYRETAKARTKNQAKAIQMLPFPKKFQKFPFPKCKTFCAFNAQCQPIETVYRLFKLSLIAERIKITDWLNSRRTSAKTVPEFVLLN